MTGKRVQFDEETWQALALLARDRMMDFQELADEAPAICCTSTAALESKRAAR
jgi:hypothetical protein